VGAVALGFQCVPADHGIEEQVAVEHDSIIEQHGIGRRVKQHVQGPHGLPQVGQNEQQAHDDGSDGQKFTHNSDAAVGLVVVQIVWQDHHHATGGHTHQVGEVGDVKAPGDIPAHAGDTQTELKLHQ
jgi:hypothetical protein